MVEKVNREEGEGQGGLVDRLEHAQCCRRVLEKLQSKARGIKSKNPFFHNFFYLFPHKYLQIYCPRKIRVFRPDAQVRPTKGDVFFRNGNPRRGITNDQLPITI
jgi:hypothetical protein